jgi:hypothetical protein
MKHVEISLRRGRGTTGRMMEAVNVIKICCKHIQICHNENLLYNQYMLRKKFKK